MPTAKIELLGKSAHSGLVCVIRADSPEQASRIADACVDGGVATVEITFTVPGASDVRASSQELRRPETFAAGLAHAYKWRQH